MPGISPVYEPNNKKVNEAAENERKARLALIDTFWKYYRDGGIRKPLKVRKGQPDDNILLNFSKQGVDRLVSFFAPKAPRFSVPGGSKHEVDAEGKLTLTLSPEQEAVNGFLEANNFDDLITDIGLSGFISGHNFMRLYPPDNTDAISPENPPRMALIDPRYVTKFWDASDIHKTLFYRLTWQLDQDTFRRQDIVPTWLLGGLSSPNQLVPDMDETGTQRVDANGKPIMLRLVGWWIIEYQNKKQSSEFEEVSRDSWPYPFPPIIDWKNKHAPHEAYGESDLIGADLNDSINFIASNTARIIKYHAHPKTIMKGEGKVTETTVDGLWQVPEGTDIQNLEMQSDLSSSMGYLDKLQSAYMSQMHVVDISGIKDKLGQLTSFAVRMLFKDMLDATNAKHMLYGNGLSETVYRACVMMGVMLEKRPTDEWDDPLPEDRNQQVSALKMERDMGVVSKQTVQEELGRDPVVEADRKAGEQESAEDNMVSQLERMGNRGVPNMVFGGRPGGGMAGLGNVRQEMSR